MNAKMKSSGRKALLLGALLLCGAAWAGDKDHDDGNEGSRPIDERRQLKADAKVAVHNVAGSIEVEAWDRNELHLTGHLAREVEELAITGDASSLRIEVKLPKKSRNTGDTELKLMVPAGIKLDAEGVSADVRVHGLKGPVDAASVSGDVEVDVASLKVKAQSVSGDVNVRAPKANADVGTVSGDVTVNARGEISAESVSGDVEVEATDVRELSAESVSGDLTLKVELAKDAEVSAESLSGEVVLITPKAPEGALEMETFSGSLRSDWSPGPARDAKEWHRDGSGSGRIELNSHSGDVELKKR